MGQAGAVDQIAGPLTTIHDPDRPGFAHLGVSRSGALDRGALALAKRLVGNPITYAALARARLTLGPRHDWFTPAALAGLLRSTYVVSSRSNRIALRLEGPRVERAIAGELPSEGLVLGAVQVPPDGRPLI